MTTTIGRLNEGHLHAALKTYLAEPGDELEAPVGTFHVDIRRGPLLIEIQTGSFSAIARKLRILVQSHRVRLVHPVAARRWLVKGPGPASPHQTRRRSPKSAGPEEVFRELVRIPDLLAEENFELEILATHEEQVRRYDGRRGRRRGGWVIEERRLLDVVGRARLRGPHDLLGLLPDALPDEFDTAELARLMGRPRGLAQKACYCLRACGVARVTGKRGNAKCYTLTERGDP